MVVHAVHDGQSGGPWIPVYESVAGWERCAGGVKDKLAL